MIDVKKLVEDRIVNRLNKNPEVADELGCLVSVNITGDDGGVWIIDCTKHPVTYQESGEGKAAVSIEMSSDDFKKLSQGELNPVSAFMFGKIKVDGDIQKAVQLGRVIK